MPEPAMASPLRILRALFLLVWLAGTSLLAWLMLWFPVQGGHGSARELVIDPEPQQDLVRLAQRLHALQVIDNELAFVWYMRLLDASPRLRRGPIVVNRARTLRALLPRLAHGYGPSVVRVPIPEGYTSFDVAERLARYGICSAAAFQSAVFDRALLDKLGISAPSAEGYLFPATYALHQDGSAKDTVREMARIFRERTKAAFAAYDQAHDGSPFSLTRHELLTLASIVEREARVPEERPTIAGVFMNRLTSPDFHPRRLQADPTVAYGCLVARDRVPSCREYDGKRVTPAMVRDPENPYSTYRNDGLPPGPICNPGLSAISAALAPAEHEFFYFVTHGGGRHHFTRTLAEHNARVHNGP